MKNIKTLLTLLSVLILAIGAVLIFQQLSTYPNISEQEVVVNDPTLHLDPDGSNGNHESTNEK